jgi:multisubunit Na+/H+ antiporter MnhB subunit
MSHIPRQGPEEGAEGEAGRSEPGEQGEGIHLPRVAPMPSWTGTALILWPIVTLLAAAAVGASFDPGLALAGVSLMSFAMIFVASLWVSTDPSPKSVVLTAGAAAVVVALLAGVLAGSAWIGRRATTGEESATALRAAVSDADWEGARCASSRISS